MKGSQPSMFDGADMSLPTPVLGQISPWALRIENAIPPHSGFVDSVRRYGVIQPLITATVCEANSNQQTVEIHVVQGRRRTLAARLVGIEAVVERRYALQSWTQFDVLLLTLQRQQRANPAAEYVSALRLLQQGATSTHVHAVTGIEPAQLKKLLGLGQMCPDLLEAYKEGKLTTSLAFQCARLGGVLQQRLVEDLKRGVRMTSNVIKTYKAERRNAALSAVLNVPTFQMVQAIQKPVNFEDVAERLSASTRAQVMAELSGDVRFAQVLAIFEACHRC
jgi:hypothetical protein